MRLNIRLCITVALFAVVQPATASEFNQVIEDFDRYIQTEKDSGSFPASVQQPNKYPAPRVDRAPAVKSAGKATGVITQRHSKSVPHKKKFWPVCV